MVNNRLNGRQRFPLISDGSLSEVYAVVGIPRGEKLDYMYRKDGNVIKLCPPAPMPENYGFIPQTSTRDDETLDVVLFCEKTAEEGMVVKSRVVGGIEFQYENVAHLKLLAVALEDPDLGGIRSHQELPTSRLDRVTEFFQQRENKKDLRWIDQYEAFWITMESIFRYYQSNPDPPA